MGNAWLFSAAPLPVAHEVANVSGVVTGPTASHSCARLEGGTARCWGANGKGQLGDGTLTYWKTPVQVIKAPADATTTPATPAVALGSILDLAVGARHSCALIAVDAATGQTRVDCWGDNAYGQLGNASRVDSATPVTVSGFSSLKIVELALGEDFGCGLTSTGSARCWGSNAYGQLGTGQALSLVQTSPLTWLANLNSGIASLAAGAQHACAVTGAGVAHCWGRNDYGQLGLNTTANMGTPNAVQGLSGKVLSMGLGYLHSCAVLDDETLWCWGNNAYGQLGDGTTAHRRLPVKVKLAGVASVSCGTAHTCAVLRDGSARCWGRNDYGQLGRFPGQLGAVEGALFP